MLTLFFIKRPIAAMVSAILLVLLGTISIYFLPWALHPEVSPTNINITGTYLGADASAVEQTVLTPIETALSGIPDLLYLQSNATSYGVFNINVTLEPHSNVEKALTEIQLRLKTAESFLPQEVLKNGIQIRNVQANLLYEMAFYSPNQTHDLDFLANYVQLFVQPELAKLKGVGDAGIYGSSLFAMRIWLDPIKMAQFNLTPSTVIKAISEQNKQTVAGIIGRPPVSSGVLQEYTTSTNGRLTTVEEFENIVVYKHPEQSAFIFLKDIATVNLGLESYESIRQMDGIPVVLFGIYPTAQANVLELKIAIEKKMQELQKMFPPDMVFEAPWDTSKFVRASLDEVIKVFFEALLLVVLVVFFFLQSWRATIIALLAIPVSILGTFPFLWLLDFSINSITLFGMVLAIGIVVDDAIIVVESVQHDIDTYKLSAQQATIKTMKEISNAVVATAFILAAVFVPVAFIPGITGGIFKQFAITIALSVLISAFVALSLTPALCAFLMKKNPVHQYATGIYQFFYRFNLWLAHKTNQYTKIIRKSLQYLPLTLTILLSFYLATWFLIRQVPRTFLPKEDMGFAMIAVSLAPNTSSEKTMESLVHMQQILQQNPNIKHVQTISHDNFMLEGASSSNTGGMSVLFEDFEIRRKRGKIGDILIEEINEELTKAALPGVEFITFTYPPINGLGTTNGYSLVLKQLQGTLEELEQVSINFIEQLSQRPEIAEVYSSFTANKPQLHLQINKEKAFQLGVDLVEIEQTLQVFLAGYYVNDFNTYHQNFKVYLQAESKYRENIEQLNSFYVRNKDNKMIPLSVFIEYNFKNTAEVITHFNQKRSVEITGDAHKNYGSGAALSAIEEVAKTVLPQNYTYEFSNLSLQERRSGDTSFYILLFSLLMVFLFLAAFYESWRIPLVVLAAVPLAIFGAFFTLYLTGFENSIYAQIGCLTLIGLSVKTSILIVEFAKEKEEQGVALMEASIQAAGLRFRPILMTGLAFIFGVFALITSNGAGAEPKNNLGWTVFGGMLFIVFISIFFIPALYVAVRKGSKILQKNKPNI